MERRSVQRETSLEQRLASRAGRLKDEANKLPPGDERDALIRRARQAEVASHINEWLNSPGLATPK
jgi:hypothetical protein